MSLAEQVARYFHPTYQSLQPVSSGFSGGRVYRLQTVDGDFALKQYPADYRPQRLREIHRVQAHAAANLPIIPSLCRTRGLSVDGSRAASCDSQLSAAETMLHLSDCWFDCSRWLPGCPLQPTSLAANDSDIDQSVAAGAAAIAEFHAIVAPLGVQTASPPAVVERVQRLSELERRLPDAITAARRLAGNSVPNPWPLAAETLSAWTKSSFHQSMQTFASWSQTRLPIQWVLRDVHLDHVLFQQNRVSGLIDFDAARCDTVAVDLARWAGSFIDLGLEKTRIWTAVLSGYEAVRPISACEQQLAGAMEEISWYLRLANCVVWVALEKRAFSDSTVTPETRLSSLLRRSGSIKAI